MFVTTLINGSWVAAHITADCPDVADTCYSIAGGSAGGGAEDLLPAGSYFLTVSTYPSPQSTTFELNMATAPVVEGCMDMTATNYDENANVACEACCEYPADCVTFDVMMIDSYGDSWNGNVLTIGSWSGTVTNDDNGGDYA